MVKSDSKMYGLNKGIKNDTLKLSFYLKNYAQLLIPGPHLTVCCDLMTKHLWCVAGWNVYNRKPAPTLHTLALLPEHFDKLSESIQTLTMGIQNSTAKRI